MTASCSFQILAFHITVSAPPGVLARVDLLAGNNADQDIPCRYWMGYSIRVDSSGLVLREEDCCFARAATPDEAVLALAERLQLRLMDYLAGGGWLLLHAGLATVAGRRTLLVGGSAAGTDLAAVRNGSAVAFGLPWPAGCGPVDALVALDGRRPRDAAPAPLTTAAALQAVLTAQVSSFRLEGGEAVRQAALLVQSAQDGLFLGGPGADLPLRSSR
jgi:hypothetical protein